MGPTGCRERAAHGKAGCRMEMKTPETVGTKKKCKFPQYSREILGASHKMKDFNQFFFGFKKAVGVQNMVTIYLSKIH